MGSPEGCVQWFRLALERSEGMFVHLTLQLAFLIPAELSLTCVRMAPVLMTSSLLLQSELRGSSHKCGVASESACPTLLSSKSRLTARSGAKPGGLPFAFLRANPVVSPSALARRSSSRLCDAV